MARVLLAGVILSSAIQAILVWDLDPNLSVLNVAARNWGFATIVAMFLFVLVVIARSGKAAFAELDVLQRSLLTSMAVYVLAWGIHHADPAVWITTISWLLAIGMIPALLGAAQSGALARDRHWEMLGLAAIAHVLIFMLALYLLWDAEDYPWRNRTPGFNNIRHLTYVLVPAAVVAGMLHLTRPERRLWTVLCFAAAMFYMFLTGARGGVLAVTLALPISALVLRLIGGKLIRGRAAELVLIYLALLGVVAAIPDLPFDSIWARAERMAQGGAVTGGRWGIWIASIEAIRNNWLFGVGPIALGNIPGPTEDIALNHPHNLLLQILLHWGVLGSVLLLAAGAALLFRIRRLDRRALLDRAPAAAAVLAMLIHGSLDGGLYYPFSVAVFLIAFVVVIRAPEQAEPA